MHTPEIQKKIDHQKSVRGWTFRYIAGGSAILAFAGGFLENSTAQDRYNDYRALNTVGDHSSEYNKVNETTMARNALYVATGVLLATFTISFAF
jgi:hypothetical protein